MSSVAKAGEAVSPPAAEPPKTGRGLPVNLRQSGIYIAFAVIVALFAVLTDGQLLSPGNISNIIVQNSYILILAIGMILVIIGGHIDLSVGSVVALTGAIAAVLMVNHDVPWPLALALTLLAGAAIGAWQGYWIAYFGIPAFIVTLGGMLMFRALTLTVLDNQRIGPFPDDVRTIANGFLSGYLGNIGLGFLGGATCSRCWWRWPWSAGSSCSAGGGGRAASGTGSRSTRSRCSRRRTRWPSSW
ncbi:ABC transporter permease subunit [Actinomadura sp. CNU-125]|uniref:ABC transporter permease subunit n=1 Tax=Actinomadura sp. CNU-125 TaxID=1904961 RepID=UPI000AE40CF4|nr:hypothetical protein [Actinomadura sp. CNU-125]